MFVVFVIVLSVILAIYAIYSHLLHLPQHGITLTWWCGLIPFGVTNDPCSFEKIMMSLLFAFFFCPSVPSYVFSAHII